MASGGLEAVASVVITAGKRQQAGTGTREREKYPKVKHTDNNNYHTNDSMADNNDALSSRTDVLSFTTGTRGGEGGAVFVFESW